MNWWLPKTLYSCIIKPTANIAEKSPAITEIKAKNLENLLFLNSMYPKPRLEIAVNTKKITAAIECIAKAVSSALSKGYIPIKIRPNSATTPAYRKIQIR